MLKSLHIENFALIDSIEIAFGHSLNIITGETGAGKSIVIDALMALLGERASAEMIRQNTPKAIIEGVFSIQGHPNLPRILEENNYDECENNELILRREIAAKGTSRCFINDTPAPLSLVREIGNALVDFHGQHEHQSILKGETHLYLLDNLGGLDGIRESCSSLYYEIKTRVEELQKLRDSELQLRQKQEFQKFQLQEIELISPIKDEDIKLETELSIIENSEKVFDSTQSVYSTLYGESDSVRDRLIKTRNTLEKLAAIDPKFAPNVQEIESVIVSVEEIAKQAQSYNSHVDFYPERLEEIRERLLQLRQLKKKYGSLDSAIEHRDSLERELTLIENFDEEISRIQNDIELKEIQFGVIASRLSAKRKDIAKKAEKSIVKTLETLGIPNATFKVKIEQDEIAKSEFGIKAAVGDSFYRCSASGIDQIRFYISTNAGEELRPLDKVVSGGEASRIMLSIKSILAKSDRLPMLVFDEIDTGISGRISQKVGIAMKDLASYHQIIAITHQPQIAALADHHIIVEKTESKNKAIVHAKVLSEKEHIHEVAKLLSGEEITDTSLQTAKELIQAGH